MNKCALMSDECCLITIDKFVDELLRYGSGINVMIDDKCEYYFVTNNDVCMYLNSIGLVTESESIKLLTTKGKSSIIIFFVHFRSDNFKGYPSNIMSSHEFLVKVLKGEIEI